MHWALYRLKPRAASPPPELVELLELLELDARPEELLELDELLELEVLLVELDELVLPDDELELVLPAELEDEPDEELELLAGSPEQPDSSAAARATRKNLSIIDSLRLIVQKTIRYKIQDGARNKRPLGRRLGGFAQACEIVCIVMSAKAERPWQYNRRVPIFRTNK